MRGAEEECATLLYERSALVYKKKTKIPLFFTLHQITIVFLQKTKIHAYELVCICAY